MNYYETNTDWDENDSANWLDNDLNKAYESSWQSIDPFESMESCLWDDMEA
jgi:hypothetical protein